MSWRDLGCKIENLFAMSNLRSETSNKDKNEKKNFQKKKKEFGNQGKKTEFFWKSKSPKIKTWRHRMHLRHPVCVFVCLFTPRDTRAHMSHTRAHMSHAHHQRIMSRVEMSHGANVKECVHVENFEREYTHAATRCTHQHTHMYSPIITHPLLISRPLSRAHALSLSQEYPSRS